jgi:hypothetical protein
MGLLEAVGGGAGGALGGEDSTL